MHLLKNIGYCVPPALYYDNISAIHMAKNPVFHHCTKHIKIDVHFVCERVASGVLSLTHIPGSDQIADIFTKSLYATKFIPNRGKLCLGTTLP